MPADNTEHELIPWQVHNEHRWAYPLSMLRTEAERRAGVKLRKTDLERLLPWLKSLHAEHLVIHYDPDTEDGFFYIPRQDSDTDIVRLPPKSCW